ncbi:MAG: hypothetical protein Ct9H300mP4_16200 [Gammaproteobacteria bacterium]|nr:MAG: hypothetical protein Ct9H300mP4_16200 [Gammaproteobacteria bacterium]
MTSLIAKVAPLLVLENINGSLVGIGIGCYFTSKKNPLIAGMLVFFGMFISTIGMESVKF